jgi:outer membrane lipoprotein
MRTIGNCMPGRFLLLTLITLLASCATKPVFDTSQVNRSLSPRSVVAEPDLSHGDTALWGGTILDTRNLEQATQIEVLGYPLSSSDRPLEDSKPLGRFIIRHDGFLEPTDYAQGRQLSVLGQISDNQTGNVGDSTYIYPVINAEALQLWSKEGKYSGTTFHFGVGVGF